MPLIGQTFHPYSIQKAKKFAKRLYIYINPDTLQKQDNLSYVFIHKNPDTLRYAIFHEIFDIDIYIYTKNMTLCVTWRFYIKNPDTSKKARQFALRFLIYKNPDTLRYIIFHVIIEIGGGGGAFL